ncbi:MAG: hypothetical protein AAB590_00765 [Patescibacteria group bacterium]
MKIKFSIKGLFKRNANKRHDDFITPDRDWHLILIVFVVLVLSSAIAHYLFYASLDVVPVAKDSGVQKLTLKRKELGGVVESLIGKKTAHDKLLANPPSSVDPG